MRSTWKSQTQPLSVAKSNSTFVYFLSTMAAPNVPKPLILILDSNFLGLLSNDKPRIENGDDGDENDWWCIFKEKQYTMQEPKIMVAPLPNHFK